MKKNFIQRSITSTFLFIIVATWMFIGSAYLTNTFGNKPVWSIYSFMLINTFLLLIAVSEIVGLRKNLLWHKSFSQISNEKKSFKKKCIEFKRMLIANCSNLYLYVITVIIFWLPLGNENYYPYENINKQSFIFVISLILVFVMFFALFLIAKTKKEVTLADLLFVTTWTIYLIITFKGINFLMLQTNSLRKLGWPILALIWIIVISSDIGAYVGGNLWGKKLLAPKISPNKTWIGAITGFFSAVFLGLTFVLIMDKVFDINILPFYQQQGFGKILVYFFYVIIICILAFLSPIGDLLFSAIKRNNNVKDFSNILPGHGGLLDRFDSFSLVVIFMFLLTSIFMANL